MVTIVFEPHATTTDNEARLASGWNDVALSELGRQQAEELGKRRKLSDFDTIFTSDLERAYQTALLAFPDITPEQLRVDWRLRECNYGAFTGRSKAIIDAERPQRIAEPFPGGESFQQTNARMRSFLHDLLTDFDGQTVFVIGHRATHYGLESLAKDTPLVQAVTTPLRWQQGWTYELKDL